MNNNRINKDFDELEPRVTPQPTVLQCMTSPSVPEVSLIFAKPSSPAFLENHSKTQEKFETYANWKKDELSTAIKSKIIPKNSTIAKSPSRFETITSRSPQSKDSPTFFRTATPEFREKQSENYKQIQIPNNPYSPSAGSRKKTIENAQMQNYKYPCREETPPLKFHQNRSVDTAAIQNRSHDGIRSILKNSEEASNPPKRKTLSHAEQFHSSSSTFPRCHHQNDGNPDQDTVRELLILVQNQNEQIKSLQTQVEKLLQTHEQNSGNRENQNFQSSQTNEINKLTVQNQSQSRLSKSVQNRSSDEHSDLRLRYQGDQLRNAIMEKKVSIGVMTSFEFSVQNNPFLPNPDSQITAVLRECGKNMNESGETWRNTAHSSRNVALENINEDSESHPSSTWKQSTNNTQVSSNLTANINENHGNDPRSKYAPIAAPRHSLSINDKRKRQTIKNIESAETYVNNEQKSLDKCKTVNSEMGNEYLNPERNDCRNPSDWGLSNRNSPLENTDENSIILRSSDLKVTDRSPPSPDPSIHVEMREYSSDDDEDDEHSKIAPPVGWTFYKNVVGQVNRILHTIPDSKDPQTNEKIASLPYKKDFDGDAEILDSVKTATLERLKMLGISYAEHSEFNGEHVQKKVTFDSSFYPRAECQTNSSTATIAETNTSMHMKALALKYLSDEQLADLAVQSQGNGSAVKHKVLNSIHGTNMSMATMNYLQRYCLVSGMNANQTEGTAKGHVNTVRQQKVKHLVMTKELLTRHQAFNNSVNNGAPDNILDITTLKQQPKLL